MKNAIVSERRKRSFVGQVARQLEAVTVWNLLKVMICRKIAFRPARISVVSPRFNRRRVGVRLDCMDWPTLLSVVSGYHLPVWELPEEPVILDVGSNVGYTLLDFATRYPGARIFGFEMDRGNFEEAKRNTVGLDRVCVRNVAVALEDGSVTYRKEVGSDAFSVETGGGADSDLFETVRSQGLSSLLADLHLKRVDYLKMDIEGYEYVLFSSGDENLRWLEHVRQLNIEIHKSPDCENPRDFIRAALVRHGFEVLDHPLHWSSLAAVRKVEAAREERTLVG